MQRMLSSPVVGFVITVKLGIVHTRLVKNNRVVEPVQWDWLRTYQNPDMADKCIAAGD